MFDPAEPWATPYEAALMGVDASRPSESRYDLIVDSGDSGLQGWPVPESSDEKIETYDECDAITNAEKFIAKLQAKNNKERNS